MKKTFEVATIASIISADHFDAINEKLRNGCIYTHEKIAACAEEFYDKTKHIKNWEKYHSSLLRIGNITSDGIGWDDHILVYAHKTFEL